MLTIRKEQMSVLQTDRIRDFEDRMLHYIAADYPRQYAQMGQSGALEFVRRAIENGRRNHIDTEGGVAVLIQLMIEFGENFENSPDRDWALEILGHASLPAQLKVSMMRERMTARTQGRVVVPFRAGGGL